MVCQQSLHINFSHQTPCNKHSTSDSELRMKRGKILADKMHHYLTVTACVKAIIGQF